MIYLKYGIFGTLREHIDYKLQGPRVFVDKIFQVLIAFKKFLIKELLNQI